MSLQFALMLTMIDLVIFSVSKLFCNNFITSYLITVIHSFNKYFLVSTRYDPGISRGTKDSMVYKIEMENALPL